MVWSSSLAPMYSYSMFKYGKEATANLVMWRIRNFFSFLFHFDFFSSSSSFGLVFEFVTAKRKKMYKIKNHTKKETYLNHFQMKVCMSFFLLFIWLSTHWHRFGQHQHLRHHDRRQSKPVYRGKKSNQIFRCAVDMRTVGT